MKNGVKNSIPVALEFLVLNTYLLDFDLQTGSHLTLGSRIIFSDAMSFLLKIRLL